jgi:hypothetical protein
LPQTPAILTSSFLLMIRALSIAGELDQLWCGSGRQAGYFRWQMLAAPPS